MTTAKQDFYVGAALSQILRRASCSICSSPPFFVLNDTIRLYIKYNTKVRTPWGFTITPAEQLFLLSDWPDGVVFLGLVCGDDGVAAVSQAELFMLAGDSAASFRVSCSRQFGAHYAVSGPGGVLPRRVAPCRWYDLGSDGDIK